MIKKIDDNEVMFIDNEGEMFNVEVVKDFNFDRKDPRSKFNKIDDFYISVYKDAIASKKWKQKDIDYKFYKLYKKYFVSMKSYEEKDSYLFDIILNEVRVIHVVIKETHRQF